MVEIAFGCLEARWRRLLKQNDMRVDNVPHVVAACCILHNIREIHGDTFDDEWLQDTSEDLSPPKQQTAARNESGDGVRNALMIYFCCNPL